MHRHTSLILTVICACALMLGRSWICAARAGVTIRVSLSSDGREPDMACNRPSVSADGRCIAFYSTASTLVGGDTNGKGDIFVHDRQTGKTTRVSVASDGTQADRVSRRPSISPDGRYVAFYSGGSLVPDDTNAKSDVFVHDRQTGKTTRVSIASDATQANAACKCPSISADGRYVAFNGGATNLVPGDTNGKTDVFVHDRQTGKTTRVSIASDGTQGNGRSFNLSISANGRYVVFDSRASNLVPGDTNGETDIFLHDRQTGNTIRISVASDGAQGNEESVNPTISGDGRYAAFHSTASNLVPDDTNGTDDVFVHDLKTGETTQISVASDGAQGNGTSRKPAISHDGRYVTFWSGAPNLVPDDTNAKDDIFVHDRKTGKTIRVSVASNGAQGNDASRNSAISPDGRYVAFWSHAINFVAGDTNDKGDIYLHDWQAE